jgi:putative transposase
LCAHPIRCGAQGANQGVQELKEQGHRFAEVLTIGVTEQTYCRRKKMNGGLEVGHYVGELEAENAQLRRAVSELTLDKLNLGAIVKDELNSAALRRTHVDHVVKAFGVSQRRACKVLGQHRSTQRKRTPYLAPSSSAVTIAELDPAGLCGGKGSSGFL